MPDLEDVSCGFYFWFAQLYTAFPIFNLWGSKPMTSDKHFDLQCIQLMQAP